MRSIPTTGRQARRSSLGPRAGVPVLDFDAIAPRAVHHQDGEGFGPGGEKAGKIPVKAGDPMYDKDGNQVADRRELRSTYEVYRVPDVNIAAFRRRTVPHTSKRAIDPQK